MPLPVPTFRLLCPKCGVEVKCTGYWTESTQVQVPVKHLAGGESQGQLLCASVSSSAEGRLIKLLLRVIIGLKEIPHI